MAIKAIAAVVGAVAAVVGTAGSIVNANKARGASQRASRLQREANNFQAARERREAIRQSRIAYAQSVNNAETGGVADSSGALGGQSSIVSQTNDNISFLDKYSTLMDQSAANQSTANAASASAGNWGALAGLGMQVYSATGGGKG
jgi:hypothetical protein